MQSLKLLKLRHIHTKKNFCQKQKFAGEEVFPFLGLPAFFKFKFETAFRIKIYLSFKKVKHCHHLPFFGALCFTTDLMLINLLNSTAYKFRIDCYYLAHVIEQPIFRIPNILFVYFFIDFFVKHIFFEARLERVIDGAADCWSYFWSSKK